MKKSIFLAAIAALVLAGCAKTETYFSKVAYEDEVNFGAYSGRTLTKAGPTDDMNLDALKLHGFGVFATYTATDAFEDAANDKGAKDDFMYNQQVAYNDTENAWLYSPVKYWPNPTNGQNADDQHVSFFAYAPYADPAAQGADNTYGITGFSTEVAADDPNANPVVNHLHNFVNYTFSKDKPNVDLMWGYKQKNVDNTDPANPVITYDINNNLTRSTDKVHFKFQHLFAKLGGSQEGPAADPNPYDDPNYVANGLVVKANAETITPTNNFGANDGTKVTISKIVIGSAPEVDAISGQPVTDIDGTPISYATTDLTGKLDLYTGIFTLDGAAQNIQFSQTIANDLTDDPNTPEDESTYSELADCLKEPVGGINVFSDLTVNGVVEKAINVYKDESNPIILIPGTKPVVDITITYYVRTYDEKISGKECSEVPQTVFGRIKFPEIKKNTKYNIVMILGLNDVKFEAEVEDWATGVVSQTMVDTDGDGIADTLMDITDTEIGLPDNL
jgi:hypothetical protein